ncbi:MAG: transglycosylase SLT domain-containing protein [Alcaligenes sp.]
MNLLRLFALLCAFVLAGCATGPKVSPQKAAKTTTSVAADTSRTIDLTHPPKDMWDRVRRGFAIPNLHTDLVDYWTNYYASHPESIRTMSQRASRYLYHIMDELDRRGLPSELALLPFVESAYNPTAYSRSHASGLWQFIPSTGLHYKLQQDWWTDERRDPIASTNAALDYLSYLYEFQGDWYLALASYNWGEGSVRRAMERNEQADLDVDYLSLNMPEETRNYVPKLQAIKNIVANPARYGITLPPVSNTPYFTAVRKNKDIDVAVAAELAEISIDEFKALNASHNRPTIPAHNSTLLLPADKVDIFKANLAAYQGRLSNWKTYQAKSGESYLSIAQRHGITLSQLRSINGLGSKRSKAVAQTLLVPNSTLGEGSVQLASLTNTPAAPVAESARKASRSQQVSLNRKGGRDVTVLRRGANVRTHTVKNGDTLYALAKRYDTSVAELRRLNNIKGNTLSKGTRLRVPGTNIRG